MVLYFTMHNKPSLIDPRWYLCKEFSHELHQSLLHCQQNKRITPLSECYIAIKAKVPAILTKYRSYKSHMPVELRKKLKILGEVNTWCIVGKYFYPWFEMLLTALWDHLTHLYLESKGSPMISLNNIPSVIYLKQAKVKVLLDFLITIICNLILSVC